MARRDRVISRRRIMLSDPPLSRSTRDWARRARDSVSAGISTWFSRKTLGMLLSSELILLVGGGGWESEREGDGERMRALERESARDDLWESERS